MVSRLNDMSGRLLELRFAISSNAGWRHEPVVAGDAGALFIGVLGAELMMLKRARVEWSRRWELGEAGGSDSVRMSR